MSLLAFSVQNTFRKKMVAVLAVLGVAFGTALMTFLFSLANGMEKRADRTLSELSNRIVITGRDALFGGLFLGMGTSPIPSSYMEAISRVPHVQRAYSQVSVIMRPQDINYMMPLYGYGPEEITGSVPGNSIIEGAAPKSDSEILMGKSLREYLGLLNTPCEIGNTYKFIVPDRGRVNVLDLKITGVYSTGNEVLDGAFSGTEKLARDLAKVPAGRVSAINAVVDHVNNVEPVAQAIQRELSGKIPEVQVVVPGEVLNPVKNILDIFGKFLMAVSLVAVLAGGLSIMVVMLLSVVSRMREFGILKAVGWTPANIVFMVITESLALSMLGCILGVILGFAGLAVAGAFIAPDIALLTWRVAASVFLAGVLIGVAGGIYPALRACSASPARIFREA